MAKDVRCIPDRGTGRASLTCFSEKGLPLNQVRPRVEESVQKLGFIPDLLLIHWPSVVEDGKLVEFWQELESLVEDGTLKGCSLGVSNFRPQDIEAIMKVAKIKPVCNRTSCSAARD